MDVNVFGLSSLRGAKENFPLKEGNKKRDPGSVQKLQDYLSAQYGSKDGGGKKKKKKKKNKQKIVAGSVAILDQDIDVTTLSKRDFVTGDIPEDDGPVVANAEEFERRQLQELREKELQNDGGWKVVQQNDDDGRDDDDDHDDDDGGSDISPPRRRAGRHDSDWEDSGEDQNDASDMSPPRRRHDSDGEDFDDDMSPPRRHVPSSDDAGDGDVSAPRQRPHALMMSDGTLAGMVSGRELRKEMEEKRAREKERLDKLGDEVTGRGAGTVYRTEDGRAISKEEYEEAMRQKRSQEKKYLEGSEIPWGRGLKQSYSAEARGLQESTQVSVSRRDDPMAHILSRKGATKKSDISLLDKFAKDLKRAGFNVPLDIPRHSWLNRNMGPPSNRFGIRPGRHWDGVDRSNGFEQDFFKRKAELRQREQMAHYMAQEDM